MFKCRLSKSEVGSEILPLMPVPLVCRKEEISPRVDRLIGEKPTDIYMQWGITGSETQESSDIQRLTDLFIGEREVWT